MLEHANYSFAFRNVSRVFTHELVRHRAGSAFSQESLRYVRLTDIGFRVPPALEPVPMEVLEPGRAAGGVPGQRRGEARASTRRACPFAVKKEITSALRRLAPIGLSTDIIWTANVRTLRHVIEMRTAEGAEEELRLVFDRSRAAPRRPLSGRRRLLGAGAPEGVPGVGVDVRTRRCAAGKGAVSVAVPGASRVAEVTQTRSYGKVPRRDVN